METYLISYDLSDETKYNDLYEYVKSYGTWAHITESFFAVLTIKSATQIRDEIVNIVGDDCKVMVVRSAHEAAWYNTLCKSEWLKQNL
jgi:CRISPR/Cas system-associated endoribonuclease Cas2